MNDSSISIHSKLPHLKELNVEKNLFTVRFADSCSMSNCRGACCWGGVWADLGERDTILANAAVVQRYLEPQQEHDPIRWFDGEIIEDADFPTGKATGTQVRGSGCVFLDSVGRCALQKAEMGEQNGVKLKPFYCTAFPVAIENATLVFDDYMKAEHPECCSPTPGGTKTVFDVCDYELRTVVGKEALVDLRKSLRD